MKLTRGTFAATFLLAALAAIGVHGMRVEDIQREAYKNRRMQLLRTRRSIKTQPLFAFCAALIAACFVVAVSPPLKPPTSTAFVSGGQPEQPQATKRDQTARDDERGTDKNPLSIKIVPAQKSKVETDTDAEERDKKARYDWLTGWGTFATALLTGALALIAFGQVVLFVVQLRYIRKSLVDTKESAKAASKAANATEASVLLARQTAERQLRAYVFVENALRNGPSEIDKGIAPNLVISFKNFGQTPASKGVYWVDANIASLSKPGAFVRSDDAIVGRFDLAPTASLSVHGTNDPNGGCNLSSEQTIAFMQGIIGNMSTRSHKSGQLNSDWYTGSRMSA